MEKEYPEYKPMEIYGKDVGQEECYELYAEKLKEFIDLEREVEYPLEEPYIPDVGRTIATEIDPCGFLWRARPKAHIRRCSLPYIMDAYKNGEPKLQPVKFWIDPNNECQITGHEGRHRSEIACDIGLDKIPIMLQFLGEYVYPEDETGYANVSMMREASTVLQEEGFKEFKEQYEDLWKYPKNCSIPNLKREDHPERFSLRQSQEFRKTREKREKLREQCSITETVEKLKKEKEI